MELKTVKLKAGEAARTIPWGGTLYYLSPDKETQIPACMVDCVIDILAPAEAPKKPAGKSKTEHNPEPEPEPEPEAEV